MENQALTEHRKILVVEDDRYTNELISKTLKMTGFEVKSVYSGEDALEEVNKDLPDLIVLDLLLPKMDGWDVCRTLRKEGNPARKVPIVIASVLSKHDVQQTEEAMGILSFFNKPFNPTDLITEINRILR